MTHRTFTSLTGRELAALRREAGLNQSELARAAGLGRNTVSYWENKTKVSWSAFGPGRMFAVLGISVRPALPRSAPEDLVYGGSRKGTTAASGSSASDERVPRPKKVTKPPKPAKCGARTRKGGPCPLPPEPGRARCRGHGGLSTGARTKEGRARIAKAQSQRWAEWRARLGPLPHTAPEAVYTFSEGVTACIVFSRMEP